MTDELRTQLNIDARVTGLLVTAVDGRFPLCGSACRQHGDREINRTAVSDLGSALRLIQPGRNLFLIFNQGALSYLSITREVSGQLPGFSIGSRARAAGTASAG